LVACDRSRQLVDENRKKTKTRRRRETQDHVEVHWGSLAFHGDIDEVEKEAVEQVDASS